VLDILLSEMSAAYAVYALLQLALAFKGRFPVRRHNQPFPRVLRQLLA